MSQYYTTRELAERTGVSVYTLRYYEQIGLLDPVERAANGHRQYTDADYNRVNFLKRLKATGMPISEMVHYVELYRQGNCTITERRVILEAHRQKVQEHITELYATMALLDRKIADYHGQETAFVVE